jgi:hypothetical protein
MGTPEEGSPDIKTLYAYLREFDAICASHTSATNMGTDWRDNDPAVEPIVEIYQGHRLSYEEPNGPKAANRAEDSIQGFKPDGFVWEALSKGYRLGFQASSDHVSTHTSYAMVLAEQPTRQGILDAFRKRHCYAANDNIILSVRCGPHIMGDEFVLSGNPTLDVTVVGTKPLKQVWVIRGSAGEAAEYVYHSPLAQREVQFRWTDVAPRRDRTMYYYVRVEQSGPDEGSGALAWGSPMWIRVE